MRRNDGKNSHWRRAVSGASMAGTVLATAAVSTACGSEGPSEEASLTVIASSDVVGTAVDLTYRPEDDRPYVVDKAGRVIRLGDEPHTVLDVNDLVSDGDEQGLLGLVFAADGSVAYVNYTDRAGDTVIAELPVSADGLELDRDAMRVVITIDQPYGNHNGGDVAIGPDGMLYIAMGDGGGGGDQDRYGQNLGSLLGKLLRIDPVPGEAGGYTIPADNPFAADADARGEIWSYGLRNPWRFSFDPVTNDLWIADVGQSDQEEVNVAPATDGSGAGRGVNFGWSAFEGDNPFNEDQSAEDHHRPVFTYTHRDGNCSISGGVRARGDAAGRFDGSYVFSDFCSGNIMVLPVTGAGEAIAAGEVEVLGGPSGVAAVAAGPDGAVYVLSQDGVSRLED